MVIALLLAIAAVSGVQPAGAIAKGVKAKIAIVNGAPASTAQFPWQVAVQTSQHGFCGGEILNATTILTAAHCVVTVEGTTTPLPASALTITAGRDNFNVAPPTSAQSKPVASFRIHPYYNPQTGDDDVAVLTLASPLNLSGPNAKAIGMIAEGPTPAAGTPATVSGYGQSTVSTSGEADGALHQAAQTITNSDDAACAPSGSDSAVHVCAVTSAVGPCFGDSGGPLVTGSPAVLIGVVESTVTEDCSVAANRYANLAAPEIQEFVKGSSAPPVAPRGGGPSMIALWQVGQTATCSPGNWSGAPSFTYTFVGGGTAQSGPSATYALTAADLGHQISCVVQASNAGGSGLTRTQLSPVVQQAPPPPKVKPTVKIRTLKCKHRTCTLSFSFKDTTTTAPAKSTAALARKATKVCTRSKTTHKRSCRTRYGASQRLTVRASSKAGIYVATGRKIKLGRTQFRVSAVSAANGLRSKAATRIVSVRH